MGHSFNNSKRDYNDLKKTRDVSLKCKKEKETRNVVNSLDEISVL